MELFWGLGFFIRFDAQRKKEPRKKSTELCQFTYFWIQISPKQKFNPLASSHHHSSIWLELIQLFLKYAEATVAAHNYLGSQSSCDWGGGHRNKHCRCSAALCSHDASTPSCSRDLQNTYICVKCPSVRSYAWSSREDSSDYYCYNKNFSKS